MMLIEFRASPIHGLGGFARTAVAPGTKLVQYAGRRLTKAESLRECERRNPFIFYLDDTHDLDGNVDWNPARFLNHSCRPNCAAELINGEIWIVAEGPIAPGEEITFDYGYDLEDYREYPCQCGAEDCVGFIVAQEFHGMVRESARAK